MVFSTGELLTFCVQGGDHSRIAPARPHQIAYTPERGVDEIATAAINKLGANAFRVSFKNNPKSVNPYLPSFHQ